MDAAGGVFQIWKSTLQPVFQDLEPILERLGELIEAAGPHVEKLIRHQRIEKQFSNSGWLPYYSELIERVEGREGDAISLDRMISAYYRGHWTEIRREIEGRMETYEIDEEAIETLQEAFAAHESENYRSVCRLLFPEMERLIRRNFFDDTGRIKIAEMTRTLAEYLAEDEILSRQVLCLVTIGRHVQHMYAQVDDDNRDQFEQNAIPNRHATVHGLVSYSTHKHSMNMIIEGFGRCLEFLLYSRAAATAQCDQGRGTSAHSANRKRKKPTTLRKQHAHVRRRPCAQPRSSGWNLAISGVGWSRHLRGCRHLRRLSHASQSASIAHRFDHPRGHDNPIPTTTRCREDHETGLRQRHGFRSASPGASWCRTARNRRNAITAANNRVRPAPDSPMTDPEILRSLRSLGVIGPDEVPAFRPLEGGVSSDIWRVDRPDGSICVKRALARLRTEKEWHAPVSRNASEADWIRTVAGILPDAVPRLIAEDQERGLFVMEYLDPDVHPVWKAQLRDGVISTDTAALVGAALGTIHAAAAGSDRIARRFANDGIFHAIRIEPYLLRTAESHPDLGDTLAGLAETTAAARKTLVHGDVSPKNILAGPRGPVFLDAECAWYGDPAFDIGFCLNHLLLKCIWRPQFADAYVEAFAALAAAYFGHVDWESPSRLEARAAALLGGLMLARIDGASPVEYLTAEPDRDRVRRAARRALRDPPETLAGFCRLFRSETAP